ncbi:MAG TPA: SRPBCC domain-containing protein [Candidatus Deferrimicrobium sp.]|nr:SRPBCC domain-containing protein [Candidatus Deferrimicrobium sp.]
MSAKKYDWTQFTLKIEIGATPAQVFRAWTDDKVVPKWFTVKAKIEPRKNGRIHFEWLGGDVLDGRVIAITKNRRFVFPFGKGNEQVEVAITKSGRGSICRLHQYGMKTTPKARWEMFVGCKEGWTFFLTNLKCYLEHGIDLRSHDPQKCYRQGFVNS